MCLPGRRSAYVHIIVAGPGVVSIRCVRSAGTLMCCDKGAGITTVFRSCENLKFEPTLSNSR